jgi:hypothetical protein
MATIKGGVPYDQDDESHLCIEGGSALGPTTKGTCPPPLDHGCYVCLKVRGLAGGSFSRPEADFAGLYEPKRSTGGWHAPDLPAGRGGR